MRARLQGTSAGAKDQEADNFLEKRFKNDPQFSFEETVQAAIAALQNVLSEDFKATEIEVSLQMPLGGIASDVPAWLSGRCKCIMGLAGCASSWQIQQGCKGITAKLMSSRHCRLFCAMHGHCMHVFEQVGVVRESEGRLFRILSTDEVEDHLTAISERD